MASYDAGHAFEHKTVPQAIVGKVVRLITTPIGLVSEAIQNSKDKKRVPQSDKAQGKDASGDHPPTYVELLPDQADELVASGQTVPAEGEKPTHELVPENEDKLRPDDEADLDEQDWALDEVVASDDENDNLTEGAILAPPLYTMSEGKLTSRRLPFPVILPQQRPGTKTRGFVRAYAPVLSDSGINQASFLKFLKDLHTNAQASPIFDCVMVATALVGAYPDLIVGLATQIVQIAVMAGQEAQERWRTNKFLDQANKELFAPRGLFAMIVTFKKGTSDTPPVSTITVDMSATAVAKYGKDLVHNDESEESQGRNNRTEEWKEKLERLRLSSGQTTEDEMPIMCAPLIFPQLETAAAIISINDGKNTESQNSMISNIKSKAKGANAFVADYFDRRAQATYVSTLA
ncbi:putative fad binding domain protein [Phaeoacremonium minimum UCRPA7]|uniref:Putative fad binding domain protein n=1 Tax=Phaeoacremonium minimum (strain UCR-PA7) TaxID=1286976 RepID=R8BIR8_PHAM7|nr:putative fad binding domain protein [Phaeoacremonium minimum UCRPA7]EON99223.1 putative fad binding domain protein [Phaeoacremonium minimum UCRPA7]